MDIKELVVSALVTGIVSGVISTANEALKEAYKHLKAKVSLLLSSSSQDTSILKKIEEDHEKWEKPLIDMLKKTELEKDEVQIIQAAQNLMLILRPEEANSGKYDVKIRGNVYGLVQGDNGKIELTVKDGE